MIIDQGPEIRTGRNHGPFCHYVLSGMCVTLNIYLHLGKKISSLRFLPLGTVDNKLGPDRLGGSKATINLTIAYI